MESNGHGELKKSIDLRSLLLMNLIGTSRFTKMIIKKDFKIVKQKLKGNLIALKAKKESRVDRMFDFGSETKVRHGVKETSISYFKDEVIENAFKIVGDQMFIGELSKPPKIEQRAFVGGSWSDSSEEDDEKVKDETCLICLGVDLEHDEWIKDSRCSKHMTGNRKLFSTYKAYNGGNVIFGSNLRGNIIGKGRGIRKKGLNVMKLGNKPKDQICLITIDENFTLWHRRLGHANMRLIQSLASKELVRNLPKLKFDQHFCDACKMGKQAHASHKAKNVVSATRCLELLHMDLFGPSAVRSYGGNRYTLVIVDDYSRPNKVQVGFVCTMAEIGCNWARIGPSKSSQSLSIAHKWAVEID
ncbi:retrovirus-related pol polyprotein from transposon TNT 1-94 [Tanacetum coccineum]